MQVNNLSTLALSQTDIIKRKLCISHSSLLVFVTDRVNLADRVKWRKKLTYLPPNQPSEFIKQTYPLYPPAYPGQQQMALTVTSQVPVAGQNTVVVQAVANDQVPGLVPGCAFCKFVPGIIETIIRLSLVVSFEVRL